MAINHVNRADDHARRTKTALQPVIFAKCFLHWVQLVAVRNSLDGDHIGAFELLRQYCARLERDAVHKYYAGSALARVTAYMGSGQSQFFAQILNEKRSPFALGRDLLAVHRHRNGRCHWTLLAVAGRYIDRRPV